MISSTGVSMYHKHNVMYYDTLMYHSIVPSLHHKDFVWNGLWEARSNPSKPLPGTTIYMYMYVCMWPVDSI